MKKLVLVAAVVALGLSACKKDYTCTCTTTDGSSSASASSTVKDTKKNAKSSCESGSKTLGTATVTCAIK